MNLPVGQHLSAFAGSPLYCTPQQRAEMARVRFFEQGERPTGLVSEAVIQSWSRCLQQRQQPERRPDFNPVTASRIHSVLGRNRTLLQVAAPELQQLQHTLAGTTTCAFLVDPGGVVMHTTWYGRHAEAPVLSTAARVGVSLSEQAIGTNAPGITAHTGRACTVTGAEHFAAVNQVMQCAAAPVRDAHGQLAAVLDLTSEGTPFAFDAASVVALYATAIENRLLCTQAHDQLLLQLQIDPSLLGTPMTGLVGVDGQGQVAWLNPAAAALLGLPSAWPAPVGLGTDRALGQSLQTLLSFSGDRDPRALRLPSGLTVWLRCRLQQGRPDAEPVHGCAVPATDRGAPADDARPATLRDSDRQLIERTLQACGGNVSRAARQLGVSRGLIYRHLQALD